MSYKMSHNIDEKMLDKIISVAYDEANLVDRIKIIRLAKINPEVKKLLEEHKSIASAVNSFGEETAPDNVIESLNVSAGKKVSIEKSFWGDLLAIIYFRPVSTAITAVIFAAVLIFSISIERPQNNYTQAELTQAEREAHKALSIVGQIFHEANITLKEEVLNSRVAKPIRESMGIVNTIFTNENKTNKGEIK